MAAKTLAALATLLAALTGAAQSAPTVAHAAHQPYSPAPAPSDRLHPIAQAPGGRPQSIAVSSAAGSANQPRTVVILMPSLDWPEFRTALEDGTMPATTALLREGAVGLLNSLTGGRPVPQDAYVTLGAGTRAAGGPAAGEAFAADDDIGGVPAALVYRARMGRAAPTGGILHLGLASLNGASGDLDHRVDVGALGDALHSAGRSTAVLGNADFPGPPDQGPPDRLAPGRFAVAMAMDHQGIVDAGLVGEEALLADPAFPGGKRTDDRRLAAALTRLLAARTALVVVETGDLWRLSTQRDRMLPAAYAAARRAALRRADRLVAAARQNLDARRDLLLILSPCPSEEGRRAGAVLTPAIAWGRGFGPGLLISGSTRHPGLVTSTDVAPTILTANRRQIPLSMDGRPMHALAFRSAAGLADAANRLDRLDATFRSTLANHLRRPFLIKLYIFSQITVLAAAAMALVVQARAAALLGPGLVALTTVPLAYLLLALWPGDGRAGAYGVAVALILLLTGLALTVGRRHWIAPYAAVALATVTAVIADAILGLDLMDRSPLGHSLIAGARYYGIGNEYMGVLLGASMMGGTAVLEVWRHPLARAAVAAGWAGVLFALASPNLGANFGGAVAAGVAFGFMGLRLAGAPVGVRQAAALAAAVTCVIAYTVTRDLTVPPEARSHIGTAVAVAAGGDWSSLAETIGRKLAMNWKLIRWTNWSLVFLISLGIYARFCLRPTGHLRLLLSPYPYVGLGFSGVAVAALAALVFNDSGIVAAATTMIYASAPLIHLVLIQAENPAVHQ